jgi:hypothetical protein
MRVEITLPRYKKLYQDYFDSDNVHLDIEDVYEYYHANIYPYLSLISSYRSEENYATYEQIRTALFINKEHWRHCKKTFKGLRSALKGKAVKMDMMVQAQLIKEMLNNPNAKYIEMGLKRYDEGYNPKGESVQVELPSTLKVEYSDMKKSDEELDKHNKVKSE